MLNILNLEQMVNFYKIFNENGQTKKLEYHFQTNDLTNTSLGFRNKIGNMIYMPDYLNKNLEIKGYLLEIMLTHKLNKQYHSANIMFKDFQIFYAYTYEIENIENSIGIVNFEIFHNEFINLNILLEKEKLTTTIENKEYKIIKKRL